MRGLEAVDDAEDEDGADEDDPEPEDGPLLDLAKGAAVEPGEPNAALLGRRRCRRRRRRRRCRRDFVVWNRRLHDLYRQLFFHRKLRTESFVRRKFRSLA